MRLVHYTSHPLGELQSFEQRAQSTEAGMWKPRGLWVSDEDDYGWSQWCEAEQFHIGHLPYAVTLRPEANVRLVRNEEEFDAFCDEFGASMAGKLGLPALFNHDRVIDWPKVGDAYDGIVITPYLWSRRMAPDTLWYYGWDCASGCIWNAGAVAGVEALWGKTDA